MLRWNDQPARWRLLILLVAALFSGLLTVSVAFAALPAKPQAQDKEQQPHNTGIPQYAGQLAVPVGGTSTPTATALPTGTPCGSIAFAPPVSYPAGAVPRSATLGYFNNDSYLDLVVANYTGGTLSVFIGNGDGTFQPTVNYNVGSNPVTPVVGDFNGDTIPDLAVANYNSSNVSILLGNGDGTFQPATSYSANIGPYGLTVGDFNEDARLDLVSSNVNFGTINVMLGNGDGTFQGPVSYPAGTRPQVVSVGDFNMDGHLDVVVPNYAGSSVTVLLGNGNGTFQGAVSYPVQAGPDYITVADFNGDGKLDLAAPHYSTNDISILLGNGDGTFQPEVTYPSGGSSPLFLSVGDFNGDSIPDLVSANYNSNTVSILVGNGNGTFQPALTFSTGVDSRPVSVLGGDFNGDGSLDIFTANENTNDISVLISNTTPCTTATPTPAATPTCQPVGAPGPWATGSPYPLPIVRYGFAQVGTDFYVISGYTSGGATTAVNKYSTVTGTWTALADIPEGSEGVVAAYYDGRIYVVQGSFSSAFYIYDIASNTWIKGADEDGNHAGGAAGAYSGKVYFIGGGPGVPSQATSIYDIATNSWTSGPNAPAPYLLGGFTQVGQYLYLIGSYGIGPSRTVSNTSYTSANKAAKAVAPAANSTTSIRIDMSTGDWSSGPAWTMQRADFGLAFDSASNKLFAIGGDAPGGTSFDPSAEVDELDTSTWPGGAWTISDPALPSPRQSNQAGFSSPGKIWSTGGSQSQSQLLSDHIYRTTGTTACGTPTPGNTSTSTPSNTAAPPTSTTTATAIFTSTAQATTTSTVIASSTATGTTTSVATSTSIATATAIATDTTQATSTTQPSATSQATSTPGAATQTATTQPTVTACTISFSDVPPSNTFYASIECLACKGIVSGYDDGTFRPNNQVTRGQIAKIVSNSVGYTDDPGTQIYTDVPPSNPFYAYINRLTQRGYMGGYPCGQIPQEPCDMESDPYFRPGAQATRGQISKIISNAAGISDDPGPQIYTDVPSGNPFYDYINRLTRRGVMGGYACGSIPQEPCDTENRPYFRWGNNTTRGQASKIDANTFFPNCVTVRAR